MQFNSRIAIKIGKFKNILVKSYRDFNTPSGYTYSSMHPTQNLM